ncbi:MAG: AraC family transcriptional regulator [Acidobacteriota bacterium]
MVRDAIRARLERHTPSPGAVSTPFDGVKLFRAVEPVERVPGVFSPSACVIVAGEKVAYVGDARHVYNENQYLLATMPTPALTEVPTASPAAPLLGLLIQLDTNSMSRLVLEMEAAYGTLPAADAPGEGFGVAARDAGLDAALARLLELLDDPPAAKVLGAGRLREVLFAVLRGGAGERLRRDFGGAPTLATTLAYVHANIDEDFSIDSLADRAGMSRSAFDRHFKAATSWSPLQYIKAMRLSEASMLIARGEGVGDAARRVGYHNPSLFSREFRRKFGVSPREWARGTRGSGEPRG